MLSMIKYLPELEHISVVDLLTEYTDTINKWTTNSPELLEESIASLQKVSLSIYETFIKNNANELQQLPHNQYIILKSEFQSVHTIHPYLFMQFLFSSKQVGDISFEINEEVINSTYDTHEYYTDGTNDLSDNEGVFDIMSFWFTEVYQDIKEKCPKIEDLSEKSHQSLHKSLFFILFFGIALSVCQNS